MHSTWKAGCDGIEWHRFVVSMCRFQPTRTWISAGHSSTQLMNKDWETEGWSGAVKTTAVLS